MSRRLVQVLRDHVQEMEGRKLERRWDPEGSHQIGGTSTQKLFRRGQHRPLRRRGRHTDGAAIRNLP